MRRRAGAAIGDLLCGEVFEFAHRRISLDIPKSVHASDLGTGDFDRRLFDEGADYSQCARAEADLRISRDDGLHVLAAATSKDRVYVDIRFAVESFFLSNVNWQRDGKKNPVRHHDNDFGMCGGGPAA